MQSTGKIFWKKPVIDFNNESVPGSHINLNPG